MIESINVSNVATFGEETECEDQFSLINFFYGSNGSGKTTISRVIGNQELYPTCKVTWKAGTRPTPIVYNRDFIDSNFSQAGDLKGIFTLGEENIEDITKIADLKREIDRINSNIKTHQETLNGKNNNEGKTGELKQREEEFKEKCWSQKKKHDEKLAGAFEGYRNNKENFKAKILAEHHNNQASLENLEQLIDKAKTVFGSTPIVESVVRVVNIQTLCEFESNSILSKKIIGKEDVDLAAMIGRLGNSDWVREGRGFFDVNNGKCPFCQQNTTGAFAISLAEYFDETFEADTKALKNLEADYTREVNRINDELKGIIEIPSKFLDLARLEAEKRAFDSTCALNIQSLSKKIKEPSIIISLTTIANIASNIDDIIKKANAKIADNNKIAENIIAEKSILTAQVWKYIVEKELKADIASYIKDKNALEAAISSLNGKIISLATEKDQREATLRELEKNTTSIKPTIDQINGILESFGFTSFSLAMAECGTCYKLVRADGNNAKESLSEGEKSFITFLYFYCLLKGSNSRAGITIDRVVVIDDPVSSLDSEVLFIVSSLIKHLFENIISGSGYIKQIFILTHNVYFFKEITFNVRRNKNRTALREETFWVVFKKGSASKIEKRLVNPITTSYELLWDEIRKPDRSIHSIQNTMRRILEYYFKIMGSIQFESLWDKFEGNDKIICRSLFSWIHDGSHFAHDDAFVTIDDAMVDKYLEVFRGVFEKSNHIGHYKMMMKINDDEV